MQKRHKEVIGKKFNRLTITGFLDKRSSGGCLIAECLCDCGKTKTIQLRSLISGLTKSCGCFNKEIARINQKKAAEKNMVHGLSKHPLYMVHKNMMSRCYDKSDKNYKDYGERGIIVYEAWHDVVKFINSLQHLWKRNLQMDRIDNNSGYYPGNIRFTTQSINMKNTRVNNIVHVNGEKMCIAEASRMTSIPESTIRWQKNHTQGIW